MGEKGTELKAFDNVGYVKNEDGRDVEDTNANHVKSESDKVRAKFANMSEEETKVAKRGIMKNVVVISFAFMLLFTAFQSMANLQSSINKVFLSTQPITWSKWSRSVVSFVWLDCSINNVETVLRKTQNQSMSARIAAQILCQVSQIATKCDW